MQIACKALTSSTLFLLFVKLLIVTQKVDRQDPILGFFHGWIQEFARQCSQVIVFGQSVKEHSLPQNVTVFSLGKEKGFSRIRQIFRYHRLLWKNRKEYDVVFVHMTPIWVVLALPAILCCRKRMYLWYEARGTRWPLKIALILACKVFSASEKGMPIATRKSVITGHGIDTMFFSPGTEGRDKNMILTVGRITAAKQIPVMLHALIALPANYRLLVAGTTITRNDEMLFHELERTIAELDLIGRVEFSEVLPQDMPGVLQCAAVFLHASLTGLDKALLEAMACGCLVVSCAEAAHAVLPAACLSTADGMAERVKTLLNLPDIEQEALGHQLRHIVIQKHSLEKLVKRLVQEMAI